MSQAALLPIGFGVIAAAALGVSLTLSSTARLVPALAAAMMLALLVMEVAAGRRRESGARRNPHVPVSNAREAGELLWVVSLPVLTVITGLVIGLPLFLFASLKLRARLSMASAAAPALACWFVLYVILYRALGVSIP